MRGFPVIAAVLVVLLGVGVYLLVVELSGEGGNDTQADVAELEACLQAANPWTVAPEQQINDAGVGALQITADGNYIDIAAERTSEDAAASIEEMEANEAVFGAASSFHGAEIVQYGTVVVESDNTMTDEERAAIEGCLDEHGIG